MSLAKSILFCGALLAFVADASAVTMNWSYVGNLGNAADPLYSFPVGTGVETIPPSP